MTRSGYTDGWNNWALIRYRGVVASAIRGRRGQAFLRGTLEALDAMPKKELIKNSFADADGVCTLGAVFASRGITPPDHDYDSSVEKAAGMLGIAGPLAAEVMYQNDEGGPYLESPEWRWARMREWVEESLGDNGEIT